MDKDFEKLLRGGKMPVEGEVVEDLDVRIEFSDAETGEVKVMTDEGPKRYVLKPLEMLYGKGVGKAVVDPQDPAYEPLFMAIEGSIVRHYRTDRRLTDGKVLGALEKMGLKPEGEAGDDVLLKRLQLDMRLTLSMMDYSRQELRAALRKVAKSVERHTKADGPRGYLDFIVQFLPG